MKYKFQEYKKITNKTFQSQYPILHSALNQHYPVGLKSSDKKYRDYIGYKSLEHIIVRNIENPKYLKKQWDDNFLKKVKSITNYSVRGATFGYFPNYGGEIILKQSNDLRYFTKLQFFVSFIYNYYSIHIVDTNRFITYQREFLPDTTGIGTLKVIVSPIESEYGELFNKISDLIKIEFDNAKFIPFRFDITKLIDFEVHYEHSTDFCDPISKAFFHKGNILNEKTEIIGNIDYKIDEL